MPASDVVTVRGRSHQSSTPKAFPKAVAMGPMRLETLSLVAAMARRILSTTAEACRASLDVATYVAGRWSQCISCSFGGCSFV